jgi:hypothetical protein
MLLVGATFMVRTLISVQSVNLRFHPGHILTLQIPFSGVLERIGSVPGMLAAGINTGPPPRRQLDNAGRSGGRTAAGPWCGCFAPDQR